MGRDAEELAELVARARSMPGGVARAVRALRAALREPSSVELARARVEYMKTHWGRTATGSARERVARTDGPVTALGALVSVVYLTRKGLDADPVEYEHEFSPSLPTLAYDRNGVLLLTGGSYQVEARGIVG